MTDKSDDPHDDCSHWAGKLLTILDTDGELSIGHEGWAIEGNILYFDPYDVVDDPLSNSTGVVERDLYEHASRFRVGLPLVMYDNEDLSLCHKARELFEL